MRVQRHAVVALFLFTTMLAPRAVAAQVEDGLGVAYVVFSVAAVHRLLNFPAPAGVGSEVRGRVRTVGGEQSFHGTISAIDRDTITLTDSVETLRVARSELIAFEVFRGYERKWAQGWAAGFVSLGAVGAIIGAADGSDKQCDDFCFSAGQKAAILGIVGAVVGSSVGALLGLGARGERWSRVKRTDSDLKLSVTPRRDGTIGFGVNLSW